MSLLLKYEKALAKIPQPGTGCHPFLLGVANYGVMLGLTNEQILSDIRNSIPGGDRPVPDLEIIEAIERSRMDTKSLTNGVCHKGVNRTHEPKPTIKSDYLQYILDRGRGVTDSDIRNASPIRLLPSPEHDAYFLLKILFEPDDIIYLGDRYGTAVMRTEHWLKHIHDSGTTSLPHIAPNPFTGQHHSTQKGKPSYRCDAAVKKFMYAVVEFDGLSREDQIAFWSAIPLPVAALIDSGGKSIHGWIKVEGVKNSADWTENVEKELFTQRLVPLGVDPACKNESRLSRLPGHYRAENRRWQQLLYLNSSPTPSPTLNK